MSEGFRVEHRDGREWTMDELDALLDSRCYGKRCQAVCVDWCGETVLLDSWGEWHYMHDDDMVVMCG